MTHISLPIDAHLDDILAANTQNLIVIATPGSGKTTRLPAAFLKATTKRILCVEPRRMACIAAASRVSEETGELVGTKVGYHVRLEKKCNPDTRLVFVTVGMLLQYLCADPFLDNCSTLIFDEFHERSMQADTALAMARYLQREVRPDLRILVMSATLNPDPIAQFLTDTTIFYIDAPRFPLDIRFSPRTYGTRFTDYADAMIDAIRDAATQTDGDILVFLPGLGEIHAAIDRAAQDFAASFDLCPCHASLPLDAQKKILAPTSDKRRIIFSTNVAESSLTIPRVHAVIDSGLARAKFFDSVSGLSRLEIQRISRFSAEQRAGRAARLGPGSCIRLWSQPTHTQLPPQDTPEIDRLDLSQLWLQIAAWGLESPQTLDFLTTPALGRLLDAKRLLQRLGALDGDTLTPMGTQMARLPLEPRLARWLIAAHDMKCLDDAALLAAYLSEAPYRRSQRMMWDGPDLFEDFVKLKKNIQKPEFAFLKRIADDIRKAARDIPDTPIGKRAPQPPVPPRQALASSMLSAYADRLAQPRPPKEKLAASDPRRLTMPIYALMSGNRGVVIKEARTLNDAPFFIAADVDLVRGVERASNHVVKAIAIQTEWIPWAEHVTARYEPEKDRIVVAKGLYFDIFTLRETFLHGEDTRELYQKTLLDAATQNPQKALNFSSEAWSQFKARLAFVQKLHPQLQFPTFDTQWGLDIIAHAIPHAQSLHDLYQIDLTPHAIQALPYETYDALQKEAPECVTLESGFTARVDYDAPIPIVRIKIQKAFGTHRVPCVGNGKIPVIFHLLAPNGQPAQVTQDLDNFWKNTYADVRKLLRGRYPKHDWPEVPPDKPTVTTNKRG